MAKRTKSYDSQRKEKTATKAVVAKSSQRNESSIRDKDQGSGDGERNNGSRVGAAGRHGLRLKDPQNERVAKLAQILAARLAYASYKVSEGWIQQNINEIENLHSSRFTQQAEDRKLRKGKGRVGQTMDPYSRSGSTFANNGYASNPYSGGLLMNLAGNPPDRMRYQGYTSHADADYTALPVYPYTQDYYPSDANQQPNLEDRVVQTPPLDITAHPSPSMYNYLASPLNGNGPWQSVGSSGYTPRLGGPIRPDSRIGATDPTVVASGVPMAYEDFWQGAPRPGSNPAGGPNYGVRNPNSGLIMVDHALGTPGVASQSSTGFLSVNGSTQHAPSYMHGASSHSLLPAAGIAPNRQGAKAGQKDPLNRAHLRIQSNTGLRGEYSASNITMDDLDWHFQ